MIKITFKSGDACEWCKDSYTDYRYDGKCFIVIKNGEFVGFYNMDSVAHIIIRQGDRHGI